MDKRHVVIVGGGFAGLGCARRLAGDDRVRVTLLDRNNYHQFQPLLYQVATLAPAAAACGGTSGTGRAGRPMRWRSPRRARARGTGTTSYAFKEVAEVAGAITPVPGGVGQMTVACLLVNTLRAACAIHGLPKPGV